MTWKQFENLPLLLTTGEVCSATGFGKNTWPEIAREHGIEPHPASRFTRKWRKADIEDFLKSPTTG